jgi:GDPmannose 4,6-dehydratase|tara:strand:- start:489 stop:1466 length:978 start_codon:yes stop_codon:yes gene_type:complete
MSGTKRALVTGISGQDGSYLAELLIEKGYEVWGLLRRHSVPENQTSRLDAIGIFSNPNLKLVYGDMTDLPSLIGILKECMPDEVYNLAAQSHVRISFDQPAFTTHADAEGVLNLLEAIKTICPTAKVYQAGSSEMFGNEYDEDGYRRETTPMLPVSPYGCAKLYAYNLCRVYRSSYGMFISNGILFNHESPRRGLNFVTNKIVAGAVDIHKGKINTLALGNLEATRDWGHAKDYVRAMWMMLQHDEPDDFVCAMGEAHSVRDLCEEVFAELDMDYRDYVTQDPRYYRPTELDDLKGDCSKLKDTLGWEPTYTFRTMLEEMVQARL